MDAADLAAKEVGLSDGLKAEAEIAIARREIKKEIVEREGVVVIMVRSSVSCR